MELISISELIKLCEEKNINLGKGDPYNRLRYYTKIGWLPLMIRKINSKNEIEGHYPIWVIQTLSEIQNLKNKKYSKIQIDKKIKKFNATKKTTELIKKNYISKKVLIFVAILIFLLLVIFQNYYLNQNINQKITKIQNLQNNINVIQSGTAILTKGSDKVKINSNYARLGSKINVTFTQNYYPATRYWIENNTNEGYFYLNTDVPVSNDVIFNWIITN